MMLRKMSRNFLKHGKIETTVARAKVLKAHMDRLSFKSMIVSEANKNVLLKHLAEPKDVKYMFEVVGPSFKKRTGGFTSMQKLGRRQGDNAEMALLQWVKPLNEIVEKAPKKVAAKKELAKKKDEVVEKKPVKKVTKVKKS